MVQQLLFSVHYSTRNLLRIKPKAIEAGSHNLHNHTYVYTKDLQLYAKKFQHSGDLNPRQHAVKACTIHTNRDGTLFCILPYLNTSVTSHGLRFYFMTGFEEIQIPSTIINI